MKYLIALDFSDNSKRAFDHLMKMVRPGIDEVVLLSVAELYNNNILTTLKVDFDFQILDDANDTIVTHLKKLLECYQKICQDKQVESSFIVEKGNPKELIPFYVKALSIETLVLGSRGFGTLKT